jgi:diguanylate cyclase (GGDEF)-like protein/PAS domain S-box-containing protein
LLTASAPLAICVSGGFLLGGVESGLPLQLTVGTVVVAVSLVHGAWLLRLAGGLFQQGDRQTGRSAAVFCGAVLLCGVTVAVVPLDRPVGLAGIVAAVLAVIGLLALPGAAPDRAAALRRGLDGLCVALWKFLTIWVLILEARGGLSPLAFGTCLLACIGLTVAVVSGVRAKFPRGATLITSAGTAAVVFALAVLQLLPSSGSARRDWLLGAAGLLILGPVLIWGGVRRAIISPGPGAPAPTITDGTLVGDPLLVAPVLAGIAAVGYDAVSRGGLSATTLALGLAAVLAVTVRESLEALRVRRFAGQLAVHEAHFRSLVAGSSDVIVVLDPDLSVRWQSPAAARQFGLSDQEVLGRPFTALIHTEDHERVYVACAEPGGITAARLCDGFGVWRPTEFTVSDLRESPEVRGLVVHLRDVSERLELEETLRHTARTDSLTGLVNRATFLHEIAAREATGIVLAIGLDGFAAVNDVHGPDVGDALLVEVARRIRTTVEPGDLAARLSGDEFAVRTQVSKVRAYTLANRLLSELTEPFRLPGVELRLSAGVGLADGGSEDALRRAGLALRWAKRSGRGSVEWHDATVEQAAVRRGHIEQELPLAVRGGQLDLAYQPVYDLVEGRPVGVEALLRWRHPDLGTVPPLETVAAAAELGLAAELHTWVLNRACRQLAAWRREGYRLWLSVNVGVDDLLATDFAAGLSLALDSHQVDAADLVIEVSEREFGPSLDDAVTALTTVREIGVRTALDGFGAGSTYLAHLRHLPADILKVDRSLFTDPPMQGGRATPIIEAVVGLGNKLGLTVVAHGLEAEDHLELVRRAGCRFGQGFLYGQPGPAERIEAELVHATL